MSFDDRSMEVMPSSARIAIPPCLGCPDSEARTERNVIEEHSPKHRVPLWRALVEAAGRFGYVSLLRQFKKDFASYSEADTLC